MSFHPNQDSKTHQGSKGSLLQIKKPDSFNITKTDAPLYYTPFWRDGNIFLISFLFLIISLILQVPMTQNICLRENITSFDPLWQHFTYINSWAIYHQVQWHFLNFSIVVVLQLQWYKKSWSKHTPRETQSCRDL